MVRHNKREEIGQMRERVRIDAVTRTQGADGSDIETWAELATVWAAVEYNVLTSNEKPVAGKENPAGEVVFRIRNRSDVTEAGNRLYYGTRYYDIEAVEITPDLQYMKLACKALNL